MPPMVLLYSAVAAFLVVTTGAAFAYFALFGHGSHRGGTGTPGSGSRIPGRHRGERAAEADRRRRLILSRPAAVLACLLLAGAATIPVAAHAAQQPRGHHHHRSHHRAHHRSKRFEALQWAYRQKGKPYQYGGTGPRGFDCSGLVYEAYRHQGISIARTTYGMLSSGKLYRVRTPSAGDLAFYGSGHVELVVSRHMTFGALDAGTRIWWHRASIWWHPTMYFRVRGASRW